MKVNVRAGHGGEESFGQGGAATTMTDDPMTTRDLNGQLTRALGVLESHGLVGRIMAGGITAGTGLRETPPGISVFENVFSLRGDLRGWAFQPGGPGNLESEVRLDTLEGAVTAAIAWAARLQTPS